MTTNLENIKVGDMLAVRERGYRWSQYSPRHKLLVVDRITATQVCCKHEQGGNAELRFRKSDGRQVGGSYTYAEIATPELIDGVRSDAAKMDRNMAARAKLNDLEGKHLHQLKLTLEQTEALAAAWTEIKAMKTED